MATYQPKVSPKPKVTKTQPQAPTLSLPTERSEVDLSWASQKIGIIGPSGCGKSSLFSTGEKTLYVQCEAGLNHLRVKKLPCRSWDEWQQIFMLLQKAKVEGTFPYDTIVIDTIDRLVDRINDEVISKGQDKFKTVQIDAIGDIPNGAGWNWATTMLNGVLSGLENLPAAIIVIGHLALKEISQPNNVKLTKQTISIGGKTGAAIVAWTDHFLNIEGQQIGDKIKRVVRTLPTRTVEAKSKGPELDRPLIPNGWVWTENVKENYDKLRSYFT